MDDVTIFYRVMNVTQSEGQQLKIWMAARWPLHSLRKKKKIKTSHIARILIFLIKKIKFWTVN